MFKNVKNPSARKRRAKSYEALKATLKKKFLNEKMGRAEKEIQLSRLFKPIVDPMTKQTEKLKDIKEGQELIATQLGRIPRPFLPAPPLRRRSIANIEEVEPGPSREGVTLGPMASRYFKTSTTKKGNDITFGIRYDDKDNVHYIGNKRVRFDGDDIIIDEKKYTGSEDLWHLLTQKDVRENYSPEALRMYEDILISSSAIYQNHDPVQNKVKSSSSVKYKTLIKPMYDAIRQGFRQGEGSVRFYSDPNDLCSRLRLLMGSRAAGNNSHDQEILGILKELRDKGLLEEREYDSTVRQFG